MNFLRRELAPVSEDAWSEIDSLARDTLIANLSARKFVDLLGPYGINHSAVSLGRVDVPEGQDKKGVCYGVYQFQPLVETRIDFSLSKWELDNIDRGAKDIQLDSLVQASLKMAEFEENAVYSGFDPGCVTGLNKAAGESSFKMTLDKDSVIDAVTEARTAMMKDGVDGPADLIVNESLWKFLARPVPGGTLGSTVSRQIGGKIIYSAAVKGAMLASARGGDFELTVGQDFSIGYHTHTGDEIFLFMTESFAFRIITPEAVRGFTVS